MFDEASAIERISEGRYRAAADGTWRQGRGIYGGLVGAWFVRAFEDAAPQRPLRTLTVHLAAPVPPEPVTVEVDVVRQGSRVTQVAGRLCAGDEVFVTALGTLAEDRGDALVVDLPTRPEAPPFASVPPFEAPPMLPEMARHHLEYRFALGQPPYSGATRAELGGWCRMRAGSRQDRALLVALCDAWPPAPLAADRFPRPVATVDMSFHFLDAPAPDAPRDAAYLFRSLCTWAQGGYAEEVGEMWDEAGRLLVRMRQWVALLPRSTPA